MKQFVCCSEGDSARMSLSESVVKTFILKGTGIKEVVFTFNSSL